MNTERHTIERTTLPPAKQAIADSADARPKLPDSWEAYIEKMRKWGASLTPIIRRPPLPPYDWRSEGDYF